VNVIGTPFTYSFTKRRGVFPICIGTPFALEFLKKAESKCGKSIGTFFALLFLINEND